MERAEGRSVQLVRIGCRVVAVAEEHEAGIIAGRRRRQRHARDAAQLEIRCGSHQDKGDTVTDQGAGSRYTELTVLDVIGTGRKGRGAVTGQGDAAAINTRR